MQSNRSDVSFTYICSSRIDHDMELNTVVFTLSTELLGGNVVDSGCPEIFTSFLRADFNINLTA